MDTERIAFNSQQLNTSNKFDDLQNILENF